MKIKALKRAAALFLTAALLASTSACNVRTTPKAPVISDTFSIEDNDETDNIVETDGPKPASENSTAASATTAASEADAAETAYTDTDGISDDTDTAASSGAVSAAETERVTVETAAATTTKAQTEATTKAQAETTAEKTSETSSKDVELIVSAANGWNDGTADYKQLDGAVRNNGSGSVNGWTATIKAGKSASVDQHWNCEIKMNNGVMTITPVDYNKDISAGSEITFGFILKNPGDIDTDGSKLDCSMGSFTASGGGNNNNGGNNQNDQNNTPPPAPVSAKDVPKPTTDDWLSVKGNKIVDKNGKEVWITGINWFGYNTGTNTFDGLWACDLNTSLAQIADHGFNLLRVPISAELINNWASGNYPTANFNQATNSYLVGMNSLEIFDYVIGQCRANGLKIMIDIHAPRPTRADT